MINRARKNGLSLKDKSWLRKSVETKLQLETLENRDLLAADMLAGLGDLAEGEAGDKVQMRLVATDNSGTPITEINLDDTFQLRALTTDLRTDGDGVFADSESEDKTYNIEDALPTDWEVLTPDGGGID